jgi:hypothetical protein
MEYGASPLVPDGFGRTILDWTHVEQATDIAEVPLARISKQEWDPDSDRRKLRRAVVQLAKNVLSEFHWRENRTYTLAYGLLYLRDIARARHLFEEMLSLSAPWIRCDGCGQKVKECVHVCTVCFQRDFCDRCRGKDGGRPQLGWCQDHNLLEVKQPPETNGERIADRPQKNELLAQLVSIYSDDEESAEFFFP